jgi:hypothetical protein
MEGEIWEMGQPESLSGIDFAQPRINEVQVISDS